MKNFEPVKPTGRMRVRLKDKHSCPIASRSILPDDLTGSKFNHSKLLLDTSVLMNTSNI